MPDESDTTKQISADLRKVLNTHGHGFHYAVIRRGKNLLSSQASSWVFDGAEIPVIAGDAATHVDVVFRTRLSRTSLVGECKRADPAKARWCFARAPYTWRNPSEEELIFDQLVLRSDRTHGARPLAKHMSGGSYQLGLELRTGQKGEGQGGGGREIAEAIAQVLRATSGVITMVGGLTSYPTAGNKLITFIPAIFTTAQLWTTEADLGAADLTTGNLSPEQVEAKRVGWLWFTYARSPRLSHDYPYETVNDDLSLLLRTEYARSIAIVGVDGIDEFLGIDAEEWLS